MNRNLPSDGYEGHNRLEELTVNIDRDAEVARMWGKRDPEL